jgi:hypothetical protein
MSSITAKRVIINLGDLQLEVFEIDGEYRLSKKQVFESVGIVTKDTPRWFKTRNLEPLPSIRLKYTSDTTRGTIDSIGIPDTIKVWHYIGTKENNELALNLVLACAIESIERRADAQFGIDRTEEERNQRIAARLKGKVTRRTLTDAIKEWYERNPNGSSRPQHAMYAVTTNKIYQVLWGKTAIEIESLLGCERNKSRDFMTTECLQVLDRAEHRVMEFIDDDNIKPIDAVELSGLRKSRVPLI